MTVAYARAIIGWHYDPPYDFYDASPDTDEADIREVYLNPDYHYFATLDADDALIAYWCFGADAQVTGGDYRAEALDVGGGLRPDLTGRGLGPPLMQAALAFARHRFAPAAFRATVVGWNQRSLRACLKLGFQLVAPFQNPSNETFVILMREAVASAG